MNQIALCLFLLQVSLYDYAKMIRWKIPSKLYTFVKSQRRFEKMNTENSYPLILLQNQAVPVNKAVDEHQRQQQNHNLRRLSLVTKLLFIECLRDERVRRRAQNSLFYDPVEFESPHPIR